MRETGDFNKLVGHITVPMTAPSPLVGEGIAVSRIELGWVRGILPAIPMRSQPLTRLRFAKPPSPTRGEGNNRATCIWQAA
ncbi:hypothetical protein SAMN05444158_0109 [Bradyrhizobium canariense]|uniref:Uncharacterized protein n=1 Tax=Bradyrhizobium canariense TaxID=255045 RepID=A0A1H1M6T0_9BRAD|nr:hypothetical protein SAMN05444158_0109 [Bradyrhizobium canariense]